MFHFWRLAKLTTFIPRAGQVIMIACALLVVVLVVAIMLVYGGGLLAELFMRLVPRS